MKPLVGLLLIMMLCTGTVIGAPAKVYRIKSTSIANLGTLGGLDSAALDISMQGVVVGWSQTPTGRDHAFIYSWTGMVDISAPWSDYETVASGINRHIQVVGTMHPPGNPTLSRGFQWTAGTGLVRLEHTLSSKNAEDCMYGSSAHAINDAGHMVGFIELDRDLDPNDPITCLTGMPLATQWSSPANVSPVNNYYPELPTSRAFDINNSNTVVGFFENALYGPAIWRQGIRSSVPSPPTEPPIHHWGSDGTANAINDGERVVGTLGAGINDKEYDRAFIWNGTSQYSQNLGVFPGGSESSASDVNAQRFVVGYADKPSRKTTNSPISARTNTAFIWHPNFGMVALPRLHSTGDCEASALNDRRQDGLVQVVGFCENSAGRQRAVRWDLMVDLVDVQIPPIHP